MDHSEHFVPSCAAVYPGNRMHARTGHYRPPRAVILTPDQSVMHKAGRPTDARCLDLRWGLKPTFTSKISACVSHWCIDLSQLGWFSFSGQQAGKTGSHAGMRAELLLTDWLTSAWQVGGSFTHFLPDLAVTGGPPSNKGTDRQTDARTDRQTDRIKSTSSAPAYLSTCANTLKAMKHDIL